MRQGDNTVRKRILLQTNDQWVRVSRSTELVTVARDGKIAEARSVTQERQTPRRRSVPSGADAAASALGSLAVCVKPQLLSLIRPTHFNLFYVVLIY